MNAPTLQNKPSLAEFLATQPDGTLEQIAQDYQVSPLDVVRELPERVLVSAEHFDRVWDSMTEWGDVTTLVHTADIILEHKGPLPSGFHRHGYFNLRENKVLAAISEHKTARPLPYWNARLWAWRPHRSSFLISKVM